MGAGRRFVSAYALVFLFAPAVLLALGVHRRAAENHAPSPAPQLARGWHVLSMLDDWFTDRFPLRADAVRANTWILVNALDTTPNYAPGRIQPAALPFEPGGGFHRTVPTGAQVVQGRQDWLYLRDDLALACRPKVDWAQIASRWSRIGRLVRASGRRSLFVVAPDKSAVYPEFVSNQLGTQHCARLGHERAWAALLRLPAHDVLPLLPQLLALKQARRDLIYYRTDSHWNSLGGLAAARAILDRLSPGAKIPEAALTRGRETVEGDLTDLLGFPQNETAPSVGISPIHPALRTPALGRVLLIGDSFGDAVVPFLRRSAPEVRYIKWRSIASISELPTAIAHADTVIFEDAERMLAAGAGSAALGRPFETSLADALRTVPHRSPH